MLVQNCNKLHLPIFNNDDNCCCLKHLLNMFFYSENNLQLNKYSQYFFKVVYNAYSKNNFDFKNYTLDQTKQLLTILIKEICHHYMINKIKISKAIVNVALETYEKTVYRSHPDIINLASIVYNNIGCIYARNNSHEKAIKFLNRYYKYTNNNFDTLIYYNNIIKVYSKMNDKNSDVKELMQKFKLLLDTEISNIKNENLTNNKVIDIDKIKLLSFLYYNYCYGLEKILEKTKESKEQYSKGYEFSVCFLGENSLETEKFMIKLYQDREVNHINNNITKKSKKKRDLTPNIIRHQSLKKKDYNQKMEKILEKLNLFELKLNDFSTEENKEDKDEKIKKKTRDTDTDPENMNKLNNYNDYQKRKEKKDKKKIENEKENEIKKEDKKEKQNNTNEIINKPVIMEKKTNKTSDPFMDMLKEFDMEIKKENEEKKKKQEEREKERERKKKENLIEKNKNKENEGGNYKKPLKIKSVFQKVLGTLPKKEEEKPKGQFTELINSMLNHDEDNKNKNNYDNFEPETNEVLFNVNERKENVFDIDDENSKNKKTKNNNIFDIDDDNNDNKNNNKNKNNIFEIDDNTINEKKKPNVPKLDMKNVIIQLDSSSNRYSPKTYYQEVKKEKIEIKPKIKSANKKININEYFKDIINKNLSINETFSIERYFNDNKFIIKVLIQENSLKFTLLNEDNNEEISDLVLDFKKIISTLPKMSLEIGFSPFQVLSSFKNTLDFSKFFIQYISIMKNNKFGLTPKPISIIENKRIEFKFNKHPCLVEIFSFNNNLFYRAIIFSEKNFPVDIYLNKKVDLKQLLEEKTQTITFENFFVKFTSKLQEILKNENLENLIIGKEKNDKENISIICRINDFTKFDKNDYINFIITKIKNNECIITHYFKEKTIYEIKNDNFYSHYGINISDFGKLSLDEQKTLVNLISLSYNINKKCLFKEDIIFSYDSESKDYLSTIDLISINDNYFSYYRFKCKDTINYLESTILLLADYEHFKITQDDALKLLKKENTLKKNMDKIAKNISEQKILILFDSIDLLN